MNAGSGVFVARKRLCKHLDGRRHDGRQHEAPDGQGGDGLRVGRPLEQESAFRGRLAWAVAGAMVTGCCAAADGLLATLRGAQRRSNPGGCTAAAIECFVRRNHSAAQ